MAVDEGVRTDARLCELVLGESVTAYLANADSVEEHRARLRVGGDQLRGAAPRLAAVRRVILAFQIENALGSVATWLRFGHQPDEVPARIIRDQGDDERLCAGLAEAASKWLSDHRVSYAH
ncbi:hypothetical protein Q0Z83_044910 [Actinoplanes sichuanensis]|uniref:Antitoxin Xre/MbcA/ParS-like toxin-binding domain-containing protein n=1 Tax=Actinoplanes sichuanensis TaxID=512349 RepID=A0ABW4AT76_9ACTN|nr:hypothetical protein [Actinoplanes sichuanensis]BEL06300.1 hypothetical protein Q0Z83_044910 [Actinoplanes sichuanensis]